jgi:hypothetical protein
MAGGGRGNANISLGSAAISIRHKACDATSLVDSGGALPPHIALILVIVGIVGKIFDTVDCAARVAVRVIIVSICVLRDAVGSIAMDVYVTFASKCGLYLLHRFQLVIVLRLI